MADREMDREILTPCIGVCKLEDDVCIGCNRTIEEIKEAWHLKIHRGH